jgi:hypothetical protein
VAGWTDGATTTTPPIADVLLSTAGWSGAVGFFRCEVTNAADAAVAATVTNVAATLRKSGRKASDRDRRLQE